MKWFLCGILVLALAALPSCATAQHYTETNVVKVVTVRIFPGKADDSYKVLNWNVKGWDALKAAGVIVDYTLYHSVNFDGPEKYDVKWAIVYKDMAALDGLNEKMEPILAAVYKAPENRAAIAKMRTESGELVSSQLQRGIALTGK